MRAPQTIVFSVSHVSRCSSPLCQKNKRGDIWVAVGCEVEHQTPPRAPGVSRGEGRHDVSAGITSRFFFVFFFFFFSLLPARPRSPAKSVYITNRMRNSNLSQMRSVALRTQWGPCMRDVFTSDHAISKIPEFIGR